MLAEPTSSVYNETYDEAERALRRNIFLMAPSRTSVQEGDKLEDITSHYHSAAEETLSHSAERIAVLTIIEGAVDARYRLTGEHFHVVPATRAVFTHTELHPHISEHASQQITREKLVRTFRTLLSGAVRPCLGLAWLASPHDPSADPLRQYFTDVAEKELRRKATQQQIEARLTELKSEAMDEGLPISESSERAMRMFLRHYRPMQRPTIALLDNGNLRIQWRRGNGEQVSLQFRGENEIQFVFFVRRRDVLASYAGRDTFEGVGARLKADQLLDLVTG